MKNLYFLLAILVLANCSVSETSTESTTRTRNFNDLNTTFSHSEDDPQGLPDGASQSWMIGLRGKPLTTDSTYIFGVSAFYEVSQSGAPIDLWAPNARTIKEYNVYTLVADLGYSGGINKAIYKATVTSFGHTYDRYYGFSYNNAKQLIYQHNVKETFGDAENGPSLEDLQKTFSRENIDWNKYAHIMFYVHPAIREQH